MTKLFVFFLLAAILFCADAKGLSRVKRVIGGDEFESGKWPWLVSLQGKVPSSMFFGIPLSWKTFYCGASIINERWLITAAHCFTENNLGSRARQPKYWHARMGDIELDPSLVDKFLGWFAGVLDLDELRSWYLHADYVKLHPDYDRYDLWKNDIALVRLEEEVPVSDLQIPEIQAVKLPHNNDNSVPVDDQSCIMKGWGCTQNGGSVSGTAMEVVLPKVSDDECRGYWNIEATTRLCAGRNLADMGICSGDSGGPLVCQNDRNEWIQVGIASFTSANQPGNVPGVFTRVSQYIDWIESTIQEKEAAIKRELAEQEAQAEADAADETSFFDW